MRQGLLFGLACGGFAILSGCVEGGARFGPMEQEPVHIERGQADRANIELDMGAGELAVHGGAQQLLEGQFEFNVPEWKPQVQSSNIGTHATITIREPEHVRMGGNARYKWDLALNDSVLLDVTLNCGAGRDQLDLGDLNLRTVTVHMGAGQVDMDLRGHPTRDYEVDVSGGVGQATVHLPTGVGIWAEAHGGLGSIEVSGLDKHGDHYENSLYDNAKANVRVRVDGGIGQIRLIE